MSVKTTVYLPDDLKAALEAAARQRGQSEAEIVREAIRAAVHRPTPRPGIIEGEPVAGRTDELLGGFGQR